MKDSLERKEAGKEETTLITDGAYSGKENHDLAERKNIRLVNTDLSVKPVDFVFNETRTKVLRCPARYEPNLVDIQKINPSRSMCHLKERNMPAARTKTDVKRRFINVSVP